MTRGDLPDLEIRRGSFQPLGVTVQVGRSEGNVSSSTVITFELDGGVARFSGDVLPCREGDDVVAAGYPDRDGVFVALAMRLCRQAVVLGGASRADEAVGSGIFKVGCVLAIGGPALSWVMVSDVPVAASIGSAICVGIGFLVTRVGRTITQTAALARSARHLVELSAPGERGVGRPASALAARS